MDPILAAVRALRIQAEGLVAQAQALEAALNEGFAEAGADELACPKCRSTAHQAAAGRTGVIVCGECGANHKDGKVIDG